MSTYVPVQYPKWVGTILVQNAAEERAHRTALEVAAAGTVQAARPPKETAGMSLEEAVRMLEEEELAATEPERAKLDMAPLTAKLAQTPSPAAERMRRSRRRRRDELRVVRFEIRDKEISGLVMRGLLDPVARNDPDAIARALGGLFDAVPPERWPVLDGDEGMLRNSDW
jgi:hypothetical protein